MSEAIAAGLYHPNCRDVHSTWYGDDEATEGEDLDYTEEDAEADEEVYKAEGEQRNIASELQRQKRFEVGSTYPANKAKATAAISTLTQRWNAQADESRKLGIVPPVFVKAAETWESVKASLRSMFAGVRPANQGKILYPSRKLRDEIWTKRPHEKLTAERLAQHGMSVRFLKVRKEAIRVDSASKKVLQKDMKTPDVIILGDPREWEIKAPAKGKVTEDKEKRYKRVDELLRDASKKSPYVVFDNQPGRSDLTDEEIIESIRQFFIRRPEKLEEIIFIGLDGRIKNLKS